MESTDHKHPLGKPLIDRSGLARVFGYTVYRGFLNQVYGILQLKYGYLVYQFQVYSIPGYNLGYIWMNFGYFGEFFSGILVYHLTP